MACYKKGRFGPYEGRSCSECPASKETYLSKSRIQQSIDNLQNIPQLKPIDPYAIIPRYADRDGLLYYYTFWHLEQLTKI